MAFYSSAERLLSVDSLMSSEDSSFSSLLKNTSRLAWPLGGFHTYLGLKAGVSPIKFSNKLLQKCLIDRILQEKYSKSFLSSGSFNDFWMSPKLSPFSKTLFSVSVRIFLLKLKINLEQKYPFRRSSQ